MKILITGQAGFVGTHLYNTLKLNDNYELIDFEDSFFENSLLLNNLVKGVDVIVHLAAMNRHEDQQFIYDTNIELVSKLINACEETKSTPYILFSSSSQEDLDNLYGKSKFEGGKLLENWAIKNNAKFSALVIPNIFGSFGRPNYNSVVATFCYKIANEETPEIHIDSDVKLIYVNKLVSIIEDKIQESESKDKLIEKFIIPHQYTVKVSKILNLLLTYKEGYINNGVFPNLSDDFEKDLFNTFRTYIPQNHYPYILQKHTDNRGAFVEIARTNSAGQFSFSTTVP